MRNVLSTAIIVLTTTTSAGAQETRGTILGSVRDAAQGVIPGATVKITNTDTEISTQLVTNEQDTSKLRCSTLEGTASRSRWRDSNTYTIDGATNAGVNRQLSSSPNADMIQEVRVETSNFDAGTGQGLGNQVSMMTRDGTNTLHGTVNYQYWTNKLNALNAQQKSTFNDVARRAFEAGRSHNAPFTLGGPMRIPGVVATNKMFFFGNYSYVNDSIPGRNLGTSTVPANKKHLEGDSDMLLTKGHRVWL